MVLFSEWIVLSLEYCVLKIMEQKMGVPYNFVRKTILYIYSYIYLFCFAGGTKGLLPQL